MLRRWHRGGADASPAVRRVPTNVRCRSRHLAPRRRPAAINSKERSGNNHRRWPAVALAKDDRRPDEMSTILGRTRAQPEGQGYCPRLANPFVTRKTGLPARFVVAINGDLVSAASVLTSDKV